MDKQERRREQLQRKIDLRERQLSEKVKRLSILYEVGQALSATLELDRLLDLIVRLAGRHLKARKASLMLIDPAAEEQMRINSSVGIRRWIVEKTRIKVGEGIAGRVAASGESVLIRDIATDPRYGRPSRGTYRSGSFLSVPLRGKERILGVLNVSDKRSMEQFDTDDLNLVTTLAAQAAIAVENATLYKDLKEKMISLEEQYRLRDAERRQLLTLINSLTDGILALDLRREPLFVNEKAKSLLGLSAPRPGEAWSEALAGRGDLGRGIIEGAEAALANVVTSREITLESPGAGPRHWALLSLPLREGGGSLIGALTIVRDVTEIKDLDRSRSDFLNRASHQLKTPVGLIKGFADTLIKHTDLDAVRRSHFLGLVHSEASRLAGLIENLLDFSQLEARIMRVEKEMVDVAQLVGEVVPALEAKASDKGIVLETDLEPELPPVETDPTCVREVLRNLLDNSLKFTPRGGRVRVEARGLQSGVELTVTDNGSGIEEEDLPHIFEKHYVGRGGRSASGTGLGLYIAKEMMDILGGSIGLSSRAGEGTVVRVQLPLAEAGPGL